MTDASPYDRSLTRPVAATAVVGAAALLALGGLWAVQALEAPAAIAAAALVLAGTGGAVLWLRSPATEAGLPAVGAEGEADAEPPYGLVLESLPDPVILAAAEGEEDDPTARLVFANAAARSLFRLPKAGGLLAASVRNPQVLEALEEALFGRIESEVEFEETGALDRFWRAIARPLPSAEGRSLALLWLRDETDARRNERMRADFLANASHELRTPLASLTGFIETLRGHAREDAGARERFLGIMAQQADRMSRLVGDLLSLSRIELNEHIAPSGEVDLALAVTEVLDGAGPLAEDRKARLDVRLPAAGAAVVPGDRDQIIQVIQNLFDNGLKYAGQGGTVTVEVRSGVDPEESAFPSGGPARLWLLSPEGAHQGRFAVLKVKDTGPGIAREHLPRLSERFYRVEGQKSGERSGTGLGLAIVKHIVNRHRGGLSVESAEGDGSTFCAYFPLTPQDHGGRTGRPL